MPELENHGGNAPVCTNIVPGRLCRLLPACLLFAFVSPALAWEAIERTSNYSISGATGPALYASIGERGPMLGGGRRTIATTNWELKWSRKYAPHGDACTLVSATPFLTITTTLPKPGEKLSGPAAARWKTFIDGVAAHEKVHALAIRAMADRITSDTFGLTVDKDPQCRAIRGAVLTLVKAANEKYRADSRAFDKIEMAKGGNVQRLILELVNGR